MSPSPSATANCELRTANCERLTVSLEAQLWRDLINSIQPDTEVVDQAIFEALDPSVDLEALTAVPGILDGGGAAQRFYLVRNVQFAERIRFRFWVGD